MHLGKLLLLTAGAAVGILIVSATGKSETARSATVAVMRAGIKTKDWAAEKYEKTKENVRTLAQEARANANNAA